MGIHYNFIQKIDKLEASYFRGCLINQSPPKKFPIIVPVPQIRHPSDAIQFMDQTVDYLIPANLFFRSPLYYKRVIYKIRLS